MLSPSPTYTLASQRTRPGFAAGSQESSAGGVAAGGGRIGWIRKRERPRRGLTKHADRGDHRNETSDPAHQGLGGCYPNRMDSTAQVLARLRRFVRPMAPDLPPVDSALDAIRKLFSDARVAFKIVGGVAVVHHGYPRTTEDVDVLVESATAERLQTALGANGFERVSAARLRHTATGVRVDLLVAGSPLPRTGAGSYPSPQALRGSSRDPDIVDLPGLLGLKVRAARHRDLADVVELLKRLDKEPYIEVEAAVDAALRWDLARLRRDALEELAAGD
jgi:hypothetical protein